MFKCEEPFLKSQPTVTLKVNGESAFFPPPMFIHSPIKLFLSAFLFLQNLWLPAVADHFALKSHRIGFKWLIHTFFFFFLYKILTYMSTPKATKNYLFPLTIDSLSFCS